MLSAGGRQHRALFISMMHGQDNIRQWNIFVD